MRPAVLQGLLLSLLFCTGLFAFFPYMTSLLTNVSGASPSEVPALLALFGLGATAGVIGGGHLADRGLIPAIAMAFVAQIIVYAAIAWFNTSLVAMYGLMFLLGVASMAAVAPLKTLVIVGAFEAPGLASTLTSSALNLGVAIGAGTSAVFLRCGLEYAELTFVGIFAVSVALASVLVWPRGATQTSVQ
jgi:DHA1 family inner membrane transport protein